MAFAGTIFVVGIIGGMELTIPTVPITRKAISIHGNNTGSTANLAAAMRAVATVGIKPVIDRIFSFEAAVEGYRFLESAAHFGKVAIDLGS